MLDQGLNTHWLINMSTYESRHVDFHRNHECAIVFVVSVFLQRDTIVLKQCPIELRLMEDSDGNRLFEVELNEIKKR